MLTLGRVDMKVSGYWQQIYHLKPNHNYIRLQYWIQFSFVYSHIATKEYLINLFRFQLTAFQRSWDGVHSRVQQCRALTSSSGGRESRCQLSWGSTTPVYCRFSCMGQSAGRLPRKTHVGSMSSINGVSVCFSASSRSPMTKFNARSTNLYLWKLSRHGV